MKKFKEFQEGFFSKLPKYDEAEINSEHDKGIDHIKKLQKKYKLDNHYHDMYRTLSAHYSNHGIEGKKHYVSVESDHKRGLIRDNKRKSTYSVNSSIPALKTGKGDYSKKFKNRDDAFNHMSEIVDKYHKDM